jgi:hypothetical protein
MLAEVNHSSVRICPASQRWPHQHCRLGAETRLVKNKYGSRLYRVFLLARIGDNLLRCGLLPQGKLETGLALQKMA